MHHLQGGNKLKLSKKRITCMIIELVIVLFISILGIANFGYADKQDWMIALMFLGIPAIVLVFIIIMYNRYDKFYTNFKFVVFNFLISFMITFVVESILILAVFGIKMPQYKLFIFALAFGLMTAVFALILSAIFARVASKETKRKR